MKKVFKRGLKLQCSGFSIIALIIAILSSNGVNNVNETNLDEYVKKDAQNVTTFIENNFEKFVKEYNDYADDFWTATYVEEKKEILINECGQEYKGMFIDFNDQNGYAVVGNDYNFLDFTTKGTSPFHMFSDYEYYYSTAGGYYYIVNNEYFSVKSDNNAADDYFDKCELSKHYDGQESDAKGCGKITNTDKYVENKYGSGWTLSSSKRLSMTGFSQWDLSAYVHNKIEDDELHQYSEGNCWMVSAYTVLQYMSDTRWSRMPDLGYVSYDAKTSEPNIYSKYYDENGINISKELTYNSGKSKIREYVVKSGPIFPELYRDVREFVNDKYKKTDGGTIYQTSAIIENIANEYDYDVNAKEHIAWGAYADTGTKELDKNRPLLWSTSSDTYGAHTMAVCGYKYYSKTSGWWIFKTTNYKLFYELRDGHSVFARYYDMSGHVGFSAIISLDF